MAVPSADYYLSTEDKYQTFYVSSSCFIPSLTVTNTIDQEVEVIANILCHISTGNALIISSRKKVIFPTFMLAPLLYTNILFVVM